MIFYVQNAQFSQFFQRSRFIFSIILKEIWQEHVKNDVLIQLSTLSMTLPPPTKGQILDPPLTIANRVLVEFQYIINGNTYGQE